MLSCRFILYLAYFQKVSGQTVLVGKEVEAESKAQFEADSEPESEAESETKSESESMVRWVWGWKFGVMKEEYTNK